MDITNAIPINPNESRYYLQAIEEAITNLNLESTYGGCGPIVMIGIFDFYARYLDYNEIINDVNNVNDKLQMCEDILRNTDTNVESNGNTITMPYDYTDSFNELIDSYGLHNKIQASWHTNFWGFNNNYLISTLKVMINRGLPVTLFSDTNQQYGSFSGHYSNIYAYETWIGKNDNEEISLIFLKGRTNFKDSYNCNYSYYCDARILEENFSGCIYYSSVNENEQFIPASTFSTFVNDNNQGQYFYYEKRQFFEFDYSIINTNRLRCSYIENQYLVLSPKKENAGTAFLEIEFSEKINFMTFDIGIWSQNEGINTQTFKIQYFYNNEWVDHINVLLDDIKPKNKDSLTTQKVRFRKNISKFRFLTINSQPTGNSNKGRIVLDNLRFLYY